MIITANKDINSKALAWAIRKQTGVNLGGYNETEGIVQLGSIRSSDADGCTIECPDSKAAQIQAILDLHDSKAAMPADVPADPVPAPQKTHQQQYDEAVLDSDKLKVLARIAGLQA